MVRFANCLVWALTLLAAGNLHAQPENLYHVSKHGENGWRSGYVNKDGKLIVDYIYSSGRYFKDGFAVVYNNNRQGLINSKGDLVLPVQYIQVDQLPGGLVSATVHPDSLYLFDTSGKVIFAGVGGSAYAYPEINRIVVNSRQYSTAPKTATLLDMKGRIIKQFSSKSYASIDRVDRAHHTGSYSSKLLGLVRDEVQAYTDLDGNILIDSIRPHTMSNGDRILSGTNKAALVDSSLHMLIPFTAGYTEISFIGNTPLYNARKNDKYGVVDRNGKTIIDFKLKNRISSSNAHILESYDPKTGKSYEYYDYKGNLIAKSDGKVQVNKWPTILPVGDSLYRLWQGKFLGEAHKAIDPFNEEGFTVVEDGKRMGVMDSNGKVLFTADYPYLSALRGGRSAAGIYIACPACESYPCAERMVINNETFTRQFFYLDAKGKKLFDSTYDMILPFKDGQARVVKKCNTYLIDANGKPIGDRTDFGYFSTYAHGVRIMKKKTAQKRDETIYSQEGPMQGKKDDEVALMDRTGKIVSPVVNFISTKESSGGHMNYRALGGSRKNRNIPSHHSGSTVEPEFRDGLVKFKKGDYWGLMDTTGKIVTTDNYTGIEQLGDMYKVTARGDKWQTYGALDSKGNIIIPAEYYDLHFYSEGKVKYFAATKDINGPITIIDLTKDQ